MKAPSRIGIVVGGISIAFSVFCFVITAMFTPAFMLAALFGAISGVVALAFKAKRMAIVAFVFALTPCGFLLPERVGFVPLGFALFIAAWALIDYSRARRTVASVAA